MQSEQIQGHNAFRDQGKNLILELIWTQTDQYISVNDVPSAGEKAPAIKL